MRWQCYSDFISSVTLVGFRAESQTVKAETLPYSKEEKRAYNRKWHRANRGKHLAQMREWRQANRQKHLESSRAWHERNREQHLAQMRAWRRENREYNLAYFKDLRKKKREKNPYDSATSPREYSRWYHRHHPGYFSQKTGEWLQRQPARRRKAIIEKKVKKERHYVNAYKKLKRRITGKSNSPPSFTAQELKAIQKSEYLTKMYEEVRARFQ